MSETSIRDKNADSSQSDLDPKDWDNFSQQAHRLLDAAIERMKNAKKLPWKPVDQAAREKLMPPLPINPTDTSEIVDALVDDVLPYATGNTHPRFFGWVHGTGMASGILSEIATAAMNSNCGGRDHGAIYAENCVLNWCKEIFDFPEDASGLLTVGTSQATILALTTARARALGLGVREEGILEAPLMTAYCAQGTHSCVEKALQVMGHGSDILRKVGTHGVTGGMDAALLKENIEEDIKNGCVPLCVVATAGSVNVGAFDDINAIADLCAEHNIWLHVDGAYGAWARIADKPWSNLTSGIDRADSLAFDFHKWMSVQYDCGVILIQDSELHYNSFQMRPAYLAQQASGLGGGDKWFCDFGTDLSRGFRALKVWTAMQEHGLNAFSKVITENCQHAAYMAELVDESQELTLAAPVVANICTFYAASPNMNIDEQNKYNESIAQRLQNAGDAVFSTTKIDGRTVLRAAIVNHRTRFEDIDFAISATVCLINSEKNSKAIPVQKLNPI